MKKALCAAIFALSVTACATPGWLTVEAPVEQRPSPAVCAPEPAEPVIPDDALANGPAERWAAEIIAHARRGWSVVAKERARRCSMDKAGLGGNPITVS